jgi:hypothetical protein
VRKATDANSGLYKQIKEPYREEADELQLATDAYGKSKIALSEFNKRKRLIQDKIGYGQKSRQRRRGLHHHPQEAT